MMVYVPNSDTTNEVKKKNAEGYYSSSLSKNDGDIIKNDKKQQVQIFGISTTVGVHHAFLYIFAVVE